MENIPLFQTSHAILLLSGKYVLQLRENKPTIAAPGQWSLFGGKLFAGEAPSNGVRREIHEELGIEPARYRQLWFEDYFASFENKMVRTWFFDADVTDIWGGHVLHEGSDVKAFRYAELSKLKVPAIMRTSIERHYKEVLKGGHALNGRN